jgi:hypothetical protein
MVAELDRKGFKTLFLIKSEKQIEELCRYYRLPYISIGKKGKGRFQRYILQIFFLIKSIWIVNRKRAKLGLGVSMTLPLVSKVTKLKSIAMDDDDMAVTPVFSEFANKANHVLTPSSLAFEKRGKNHITYPGYHELAYLHPKRFKPDKSVLKILGIKEKENWFIVRFNDFNAHHDSGEKGMSFNQKRRLIEKLKLSGKVFISTESSVDKEFKSLVLPLKPELIHSALALSTMYVGESQTMTSEAAVLGTPSFKCNSFAGRLSIPNELEYKYGLCYSYLPGEFDIMLGKIDELLHLPNLKNEWQLKRQKMLQDKIDVTAFLAWFIEDYPSSVQVLRENPTYTDLFK